MSTAPPIRRALGRTCVWLGVPGLIASVLALLLWASQAASHDTTLSGWWPVSALVLCGLLCRCGKQLLTPDELRAAMQAFEHAVARLRRGSVLIRVVLIPLAFMGFAIADPTRVPRDRMIFAALSMITSAGMVWALGEALSRRGRRVILSALLFANLVLIALACIDLRHG
jgi:hypothetical protein